LKPYWGKPAVRNFRGDDGNVGIIRSPVRAIALPDNRGRESRPLKSSTFHGALFRQLSEFLCKIDYFPSSDYRIINTHEGQDAYLKTGTGCPLPDLWGGAGREVRTQHGTAPYRASS